MTEWYYAIDGQQHGPVSDRELHDLAGAGTIQPTDLLWRDGFGDWAEASTVSGLFPRSAAVPPVRPVDRMLETTVAGDRQPLDELELLDEPSAVPHHFDRPRAPATRRTPDDLKVPLLVSGVFNIAVGSCWALTCIGLILAIPMWILAYYELRLFGQADRISTGQFADDTKRLSIYQIIFGIFNTPTLVCGIILMIQSGKYENPRGYPA